MNNILELYKSSSDWIDLIRDLVFAFGAIYVFKALMSKSFRDKRNEIKENLEFREKLENQLNSYVIEKSKNKVTAAIRFVYWKNYPWKLDNDGFPNSLYLHPTELSTLPSGFLDNTGVNFEEHFWYLGQSIYVDTNGIFFVDEKNKTFKEFREYKDSTLRFHLPFINIINFDFRELIEYEPVFYIKFPYTKTEKLYDDEIILCSRDSKEHKRNLLLKNQMKKYSHTSYFFKRVQLISR